MKELQEKFGERLVSIYEHTPNRLYIEVNREDLQRVVRYLFRERDMRFITASGVDGHSNMEILYHFSEDKSGRIFSVRVKIPKDDLRISSLISIIKGMEFIEREIHEMLGIEFVGHPNLKRLLLSEDWPEGIYPLRRDEKGIKDLKDKNWEK
ncbi:NADH-quinone oxidoreductase subunit C [Candidatus Calescamantes bacterium]|nr:NADH-quinone oxidoreductase subunit C [Candidatus Calescamantes bacterium]